MKRRQAGMSLIEMLIVVALASTIAAATVGFSVPWMVKQTMHGAAVDVQAFMQLGRVEAVTRNHECRVVIDTATGDLGVWDTLNTAATTDDVLLHFQTLPESVAIDRPDVGAPVTLDAIPSTASYQTVFNPEGAVTSGPGEVFLRGGTDYGRISVYVAGGVELSRWTGTGWEVGL